MLSAIVLGALFLAKPAAPPPMMLRKNIRNLTTTELQGFRDAVAAMQALPATDPCSWEFQANIHYNMCNHSVDYWLPWHRMYLYYFEKILVGHSGGKLKGLPYWDYARSTQTTFPASFYPSTYTSGGSTFPNALYYTPRTNVTSSSFALSFSSTDPATANSNLVFNGFSGSLQGAPHNYVHGAIGGTMGNFHSPLDPIFWVHHCVLDRLWQKWLALGGGRSNPIGDPMWMNTAFTFYDYDNGCAQATLKVKDVLDPETQLHYRYVEPIRWHPPKWYWKWIELIPPIHWPIPRDYIYGYQPIRYAVEVPSERLQSLTTASRKASHQINVILNFHVSKGEGTLVPYDLYIVGANGRRVRLGTLAVFGIRHEHMEGMSHEDMETFKLTLAPAASLQFLAAMRAGKVDFALTPLMKDVRRQVNAQPLVMSLESIAVMEAVRVDKNGKRIGG
jgi:hypothetical protein